MCITSSAPVHNGHLPLSVFLLIPFNCHNSASSQFHFFLSLNPILCTNFYPNRSSFLGTVLMSFSPTVLFEYFIFQYHYIYLSLSLLFLSSYTLVASSKQMLIQYYTVLLSNPQSNFSHSSSSSAIRNTVLPDLLHHDT